MQGPTRCRSSAPLQSVHNTLLRGPVEPKYDTNGNLVKAIDIGGGEWDYGYDSQHRLTTIEDPRRHTVVTNIYNTQNRVTDQKDALGDETQWSYAQTDAAHSETVITDPNGNVTDEHFTDNVPVQVTTAQGTSLASTTTTTYDAALNPIQVVDGRGKTWTYTYDANGKRLTATDPLSRTTSWTYDARSNRTSALTQAGVLTTYSYNSLNNLTSASQTLAPGQTVLTTYHYDDSSYPSQLTSVTDPDLNTTSYGHDGAGDLTSVTDAVGNKTTYGYDSAGRKTSAVSPKGNVTGGNPALYTTTYTLDNFGKPTLMTDQLGKQTKYVYDADENVASTTDALTHTTTYVYDAANQQTEIHRPDASVLKTGYDAAGNMTSQTDAAGNKTRYAIDAQARLASTTTPLGKVTSYTYDQNGNRVTLTDADGRVTTNTYDTANELTNIAYSDATTPNVTYTYTADGQRKTMVDGTGATTDTYDALDRLTSVKNGASATTAYGLDLAGNVTSVTYPNGHNVTRALDADERIHLLTDWLGHTTTFAYDANSNLASTTFPDTPGTVDASAYDQADRTSSIAGTQGSSTLLGMGYTRNADGQVLSEADTGLPGPPSPVYTYNSLGQLATASQTGSYTYDSSDSPTLQHGNTLHFNADNQLTYSGSSTYSFNNEGDRTSNNWGTATETYGYDQAGNLTSVSQPDYGSGPVANTYTYDGDGLRQSLTQRGSLHQFTWDSSQSLPVLLCENTACYLYGPNGEPVEMIDGYGNPYYFHLDQQNSVRMVTKQDGTVDGTYTYDPYGRVLAQTGTSFTRLEYDSQWFESASGLYNLRARSYDPSTAQFMARDPLNVQTRQAYVYAGNDPLNGGDPSGAISLSGIVGGVVRGVATLVQYGTPLGQIDSLASVLTGHTVGQCLGAGAQSALAVSGQACYMATPGGQSGISLSWSGGGGAPAGANGFVGLLYSNGHDLACQGGPFTYGSGTVGEGPFSLGGSYAGGGKTWDSEVGWAPSVEVPLPASGQVGISHTSVYPTYGG